MVVQRAAKVGLRPARVPGKVRVRRGAQPVRRLVPILQLAKDRLPVPHEEGQPAAALAAKLSQRAGREHANLTTAAAAAPPRARSHRVARLGVAVHGVAEAVGDLHRRQRAKAFDEQPHQRKQPRLLRQVMGFLAALVRPLHLAHRSAVGSDAQDGASLYGLRRVPDVIAADAAKRAMRRKEALDKRRVRRRLHRHRRTHEGVGPGGARRAAAGVGAVAQLRGGRRGTVHVGVLRRCRLAAAAAREVAAGRHSQRTVAVAASEVAGRRREAATMGDRDLERQADRVARWRAVYLRPCSRFSPHNMKAKMNRQDVRAWIGGGVGELGMISA